MHLLSSKQSHVLSSEDLHVLMYVRYIDTNIDTLQHSSQFTHSFPQYTAHPRAHGVTSAFTTDTPTD